MESVNVIRVAELLNRSQPCTATCSLNPASSKRQLGRNPPFPTTVDCEYEFGKCEEGSNYSPLEVLDRPAVVVGRVVLPTEDVLKTCKCPGGNSCLVFLDGDVGICCDILSFDVDVIRREIRVLSWNYNPFKGGGGFLEIISWEFLESGSSWMRKCSGVSSLRLELTDSVNCMDDPKAHYFAHGFVDAVSPVNVQRIEDKENGSMTLLRGFLVDIMSCQCKMCKLKDSEVVFCNVSKGEASGHCYDKLVTVYLSGSMSSLHPVITKLSGCYVFLSFLKKKMIFIGRKECQLMYITTMETLLRVLKLINRQPINKSKTFKGKGESGAYTGVIKGIYMQGMILELDNEVWLVLDNNSASLPHSLRVGAIISVQNVHFIKCKFSWTKKLILGGCVRTITNVMCFSPFTTSFYASPQSSSQLGKFIYSLTFSARLWVLLLVSSLRKKFSGILSDKKILGSRHSKGLVQAYASSHLPLSNDLSQIGVFKDFCYHASTECTGKETNDNLKLVLPIITFIHTYAYSLRKYFSYPLLDYERSNSLPIRKIVSSEDINVVLVGMLQVSPSTGRLQLIDATGRINIVIPDLSSNLDTQNIYEVRKYSILIEDVPNQVEAFVHGNKFFPLKHVFHKKCVLPARMDAADPHQVEITPYIHCQMDDLNIIYRSTELDNGLDKVSDGIFSLLKLTHKFPMLRNAPTTLDDMSMFAEVIILPWNMILAPGCSYSDPSKNCEDGRSGESDLVTFYNKRRKCIYVPRNGQCGSLEKLNGTMTKSASLPCKKSSILQACGSNCSDQIPCRMHIKSGENQNMVISGLLNCLKSDSVKKGGSSTANAKRILLEFKTDTFLMFEALKIGVYYIMKNEKGVSWENSFAKVLITPVQNLWSLSFAYIDNSNYVSPGGDPPVGSCNNDDIYSEMISLRKDARSLMASSDVVLHLSSKYRNLFEGNSRDTQEGCFKSLVALPTLSRSLVEGKLISFHGHVLAVDSSYRKSVTSNDNFERFGGFKHIKTYQRSSTCSRIRVLSSNDTVRVLICSGAYPFPTGFGPGVDANFHRILHSREDEYRLTPVSFIEIASVRAFLKHNSCEHSSTSRAPESSKFSTSDSITSGLFYQMLRCSDSVPLWIRCRVLSIHTLVFEKNDSDAKDLECNLADYPDISLAGFILDDGSSTFCCWAHGDKAAAFLKTNKEVPWQAVESKGRHSAASHHLKNILKQKGRITMKNYGPAYELPDPDLIVSVTSPKILDKSEEELIKCIVIDACVGTPLNVLCSVMGMEAVKQLEKHVKELEMELPPMPNIWANEVCFANLHNEAWKLIQDLC